MTPLTTPPSRPGTPLTTPPSRPGIPLSSALKMRVGQYCLMDLTTPPSGPEGTVAPCLTDLSVDRCCCSNVLLLMRGGAVVSLEREVEDLRRWSEPVLTMKKCPSLWGQWGGHPVVSPQCRHTPKAATELPLFNRRVHYLYLTGTRHPSPLITWSPPFPLITWSPPFPLITWSPPLLLHVRGRA